MPSIVKTPLVVALAFLSGNAVDALAPRTTTTTSNTAKQSVAQSRRDWLAQAAAVGIATTILPTRSTAAELDVDSYLKSGGVSMPMGVSGQGGKMRPETGVIFRDGSEVSRDPRSGDVLAEILLKSKGSAEQPIPVLTTFSSPWPLGTYPMWI